MAEKKPTFYMMVGIPGSGKTTYAHNIPDALVFSSDSIREELGVDGGDSRANGKVFSLLHERIRSSLAEGNDTVYDATNIKRIRRGNFLNEINDLIGKKVCVFFDIPTARAIRQNADRITPVPENVIKRMDGDLQSPNIGEGWDEIRIVRDLPKRNIDRIREMTPQEMAAFLTDECDYSVDHAFAYSGASKQDLIADYVDWLNRPADM